MAIETTCPHCTKGYRLKDDLAGKRVTCGNAACRKQFQVPGTPGANGTHPKPAKKPAEPAIDAEALAAAALADDPGHVVPQDQRKITLTCPSCDEKWDVPWAMQGKNVLCPSCRARIKVPEQKTGKVDWRDPKAGRPTLAKIEELEGVQASTDAGHVSGETLFRAGVIKEDIEPRPRWHYVVAVLAPLALIGVVTLGALALLSARKEGNRDKEMADAVAEMTTEPGDTIPPAELPLFKGVVLMAAGEYDARAADNAKRRNDAVAHFARARGEIDGAPASPGRDLLLGELAVAQLVLGGTAQQVADEHRIRWTAPGNTGKGAKISEKVHYVQEELRQTLAAMKREDKRAAFELRLLTVRRVAHEMARQGESSAAEPLAGFGFFEDEQAEAAAMVAAEVARAAGDTSDAPAKQLFVAVGVPADPPTGVPGEKSRVAHAVAYMLQKKEQDALDLARRGDAADAKCRALALVAEWAGPDIATQAVMSAADAVATIAKGSKVADVTLVRLARQAGRVLPEKADGFVAAIDKPESKAWAKAEALRAQLAAEGDKAADEARAEIPDNPRDIRVGQAWARLALARHNARATANKPPAVFDRWGKGTFKPFGLAGLALGLQDRDAR